MEATVIKGMNLPLCVVRSSVLQVLARGLLYGLRDGMTACWVCLFETTLVLLGLGHSADRRSRLDPVTLGWFACVHTTAVTGYQCSKSQRQSK